MAYQKPALDHVLRDEADFANSDYRPYADSLEIQPSMFRRYSHPTQMWEWRQRSAQLLGDLQGLQLLDFGCGMGEESMYLAKLGAIVTGIDISEVGVESLKRRAQFNGLSDRVHAYEMRVDPTEFADESFDRVHGLGILHHVKIEPGLAEVWRLLKPGGIAVFLEPMGDSAFVERIKAWMMQNMRIDGSHGVTEHEENLHWQEIAEATKRFSEVRTYPYHLLYRAHRLLPKWSWNGIRRLDYWVLGIAPWLRRYAGGCVIYLRK